MAEDGTEQLLPTVTGFAARQAISGDFLAVRRSRHLVASGDARVAGTFLGFGLRLAAKMGSRWALDDAAFVARCGAACHAGEPRALAAVARRTAAQPQMRAAGQPDAIAILMRRTLMRTSAPILSSLRRIVPQVALANGV